MKSQWESISNEQEKRFQEFSQRKQLIEKDVTRTDRKLEFFAGDNNPNVQKLFNVLMTYCMYNFDLGYVQGMSDLLAPILRLVGDEEETFWCFVGLMEMEEKMFEISQGLMKTQLECLGKLIKYLYPHFWTFLEKKEAQNLYFCFRWLLISFKREFDYNDVMTLWEALWTQTYSINFRLFICCAILEGEKDEMMKNDYDFNDILKHSNNISYKMDVNYILSRAESICLQMQQQAEDLPDHIKDLINLPENTTNGQIETGQPRQNNINNDDNITTIENNIACNSSDTETHNNSNEPPLQQQQQQQQQPSATASNQCHGNREGRSSDEVVELIATAHSVF